MEAGVPLIIEAACSLVGKIIQYFGKRRQAKKSLSLTVQTPKSPRDRSTHKAPPKNQLKTNGESKDGPLVSQQRPKDDHERDRTLILRSMLHLCYFVVFFWTLTHLYEHGYIDVPEFAKKAPNPTAWTTMYTRALVFLRIREPVAPAWYSLAGMKSVLPYLSTFTFSPLGMTPRSVILYFAGCLAYVTFLSMESYHKDEYSWEEHPSSFFSSFFSSSSSSSSFLYRFWLAMSLFPFVSLFLPVFTGFVPFMTSFLMIILFIFHATMFGLGTTTTPFQKSLRLCISFYVWSAPVLAWFYFIFTLSFLCLETFLFPFMK